jgi:hypothetical protein
MGPPLKGASIQERPNILKPFCLEDPLSESSFARGPSFVGAPFFAGALCSCTSCTCLNFALAGWCKWQPTSQIFQYNLPILHSFFSSTTNHITSTPFSHSLVIILFKCAGIHPNTGPLGPQSVQSLTFLQFNCNGIQNSRTELQDFVLKNHVKVAAIQETKLNVKSKQPSFQDYTLVRRDRPTGRGGGLAFLVHHSVRYTDIDTSVFIPQNDQVMELQGITVVIKDVSLNVFKIYVPPVSANAGFSLDISELLVVDKDALVPQCT